MSAATFLDTSYILALVNSADQYHEYARAGALFVKPPFLTTEAVLTEVGNALAKSRWRHLGVATLRDLRADADITIISVDSQLFERAVELYCTRLDKDWSLTDCISFVAMREQNATRVLTTDRHFEQAGFQNALLGL